MNQKCNEQEKRREEKRREEKRREEKRREETRRDETRDYIYSLEVCKQMVCVLTHINPHTLTRAIRLTMLTLKLTSCSSVTRDVASIHGMVSNHADTYMMGADRNVLMTIPEVTYHTQYTFTDLRWLNV